MKINEKEPTTILSAITRKFNVFVHMEIYTTLLFVVWNSCSKFVLTFIFVRRDPTFWGSWCQALARSTFKPVLMATWMSRVSQKANCGSRLSIYPVLGTLPWRDMGRNNSPPLIRPWECFTGHVPSVYGPNSIIISHQWNHKIVPSYSAFLLKVSEILSSDRCPIAFVWIMRTHTDIRVSTHTWAFA